VLSLSKLAHVSRYMPIVDIELVCKSEAQAAAVSARALADLLGQAFGSQPGRTWVRLRLLSSMPMRRTLSLLARPSCLHSSRSYTLTLPSALLSSRKLPQLRKWSQLPSTPPELCMCSTLHLPLSQAFGGRLVE